MGLAAVGSLTMVRDVQVLGQGTWGCDFDVEEEGKQPQHRDLAALALTTPKMPMPEPMVVIVGMMSNLPA